MNCLPRTARRGDNRNLGARRRNTDIQYALTRPECLGCLLQRLRICRCCHATCTSCQRPAQNTESTHVLPPICGTVQNFATTTTPITRLLPYGTYLGTG